jgi:Leucine-rich repeat (LRR) protein
MATFITSKSVGQTINVYANTSTFYWKYNHNGSDSSVFSNGSQTITVANANGEFTLISCLSDGTPSGDVTILYLQNNQITSFDGTGLSSLTTLNLINNLLTSIDVSPMVALANLYLASPYGLQGNLMTATANNAVLAALVTNGAGPGNFATSGGRTSAGTANYDALIADGWNLVGLELVGETTTTTTVAPSNPTFITSKSVGQTVGIKIETSTGYWKYNHNGSDSSAFSDSGTQSITVANANGEFTLISCLSNGTPSGDITSLSLNNNQITSFDGTDLTSLTSLSLSNNQLTSLSGFIFPASLTSLSLSTNQLTSFDGTDLTSLDKLYLQDNQLTSFNSTGLTSLTNLNLGFNQLTSFDGTDLTSLTNLILINNQIASFDGTDLTSLVNINLIDNLLTSIDVSPMVALTNLFLADIYGLKGNPMTATANNNVLSALVANGAGPGNFATSGGRTSAGTANYDTLNADGWKLYGLELTTPPPSGNGKLRVRGISQQ